MAKDEEVEWRRIKLLNINYRITRLNLNQASNLRLGLSTYYSKRS